MKTKCDEKSRPKLWTYWEDSSDKSSNCHDYIGMCFDTMKHYCSDSFDIHILNRETVKDFIDVNPVFYRFRWPVARSEIARTLLLSEYGGIWLDADTLIVKPLDYLIDIISQYGIFWGSERSGGRGCQYNGVMGAAKENKVIERAAEIVKTEADKVNKSGEEWRAMQIGTALTRNLGSYHHYELPRQNFYSISWRNAPKEWLCQSDPGDYLKDEVYGFSVWNKQMRRKARSFTEMSRQELLNSNILFSSIYKVCMGHG